MKKLIAVSVVICSSFFATPAFSAKGISLENGVSFSGKCGSIAIKGSALEGIGSYFRPIGVTMAISGKSVFNPEDPNLPIAIELMSIDCLGDPGNQQVVVAVNCLAHAAVCGKTWFYIFDAKTGAAIAPKDMKSEKALCNAKCADKVIGNGFASSLEKERYR